MDNYQEYFINRKPSQFSQPILFFWHKRMLKIAMTYLPHLKTKTILEIGPGHGFLAKACSQFKINYCGLEMNENQARNLQKQGYQVSTATIPPIPPGSPVEVIWMSHVLEHAASYREAKDMLLACHERLNQNGFVIIIGPDLHHWKTGFWSCDWSHGFPTTLDRVQQLLHETGFHSHKALHHSCGITNPLGAWLISFCLRLLPINLLDYFSHKLFKRKLAHSFMHIMGWRQIYLIGKKTANLHPCF